MSKTFATVFAVLFVFASASFAQWEFVKNFPDDNFKGGTGSHGIAVDPDGKVWIQLFGITDSVETDTGKVGVRVLYVFNPDGSPAPFSPIKTITVGGVTDTLFKATNNSNRGLRPDHEGNILASIAQTVYRLDYKTGAGLAKVIPQATSLTAVGVSDNGDVYVGKVLPNNPLQILDKDFNVIGNVVDSTVGFSRSLEVSGDGNTVFWAGYTNHAIYKYNRPDEFSDFGVPDTVLKGFDSESCAWNPKTGYLWFSAGSYNDLPNRFPGAVTSWSPGGWYAYDVVADQVVDSLKWNFFTPANINERPRGIDFSVGGDTAYVGCFGASDFPAVQMFVNRGAVKVAERPSSIPEGYALSQNFPNPFNPTTEIKFSIGKAGLASIKVYTLLGEEVATVVEKIYPAGDHRITFDASRLSTGTYVYELRSNGVRLTNKMTFMK